MQIRKKIASGFFILLQLNFCYPNLYDNRFSEYNIFFEPLLTTRLKRSLVPSNDLFEDKQSCSQKCIYGRCIQSSSQIPFYFCQCLVGFSGFDCANRILSCDKSKDFCGKHGKCIDQIGTHICQCPHLNANSDNQSVIKKWTFGHSCNQSFPNPCSEKDLESNLKYLAQRVFHPVPDSKTDFIQCILDSFIVRRCPKGKEWNQSKLDCTKSQITDRRADIDICRREPCLNKGKCTLISQSGKDSSNNFKCECEAPFSGEYCQNRLDMCSLNNTIKLDLSKVSMYPPNKCGQRSICVNTDTWPFFNCLCKHSIVVPFSCDELINEPINKCSINRLRRYSLSPDKVNYWVECDNDDVGFVRKCPKNQFFSDSMGTCVYQQNNL